MRRQAEKVDAYAQWADMRINIDTTNITGALYGSNSADAHEARTRRRRQQQPAEPTMLRRRLSIVQLGGKPVTLLNPTEPFKFLGMEMTVSLVGWLVGWLVLYTLRANGPTQEVCVG